MINYQIIVEYLGSNYVGWQYQKNGISIQSLVEKALSKFLKSKIRITGSGRTDAGVHAIGQCANFELEKKFDDYQILSGINFHLGTEKIRITKEKPIQQEN